MRVPSEVQIAQFLPFTMNSHLPAGNLATTAACMEGIR